MTQRSVQIADVVARWEDPSRRPLFKGRLIDKDGCRCAQGDVLHAFGGWSDEDLRKAPQRKADLATARLLGISLAHAVLLRHVNDRADGAPSVVLADPAKVLGAQAHRVLEFWRRLDAMPLTRIAAIISEYDAQLYDEPAWIAASRAARIAAGPAAANAAWNAALFGRPAAVAAAGMATTSAASLEIQGASKLASFYFLPLFGINHPSELDVPA